MLKVMAEKPRAGKNSYTRLQVLRRLEKANFSDIRKLRLGQDGVWRALAYYKGRDTPVSVDFKGRIYLQ